MSFNFNISNKVLLSKFLATKVSLNFDVMILNVRLNTARFFGKTICGSRLFFKIGIHYECC